MAGTKKRGLDEQALGKNNKRLRVTKESSKTFELIESSNNSNLHKELKTDLQLPHDIQFLSPLDISFFRPILKKEEAATSDEVNQKDASKDISSEEIRFLKIFLRIKNGKQATRKLAWKNLHSFLTNNLQLEKLNLIITIMVNYLLSNNVTDLDRHTTLKMLTKILFILNANIKPFTGDILDILAPLLLNKDKYIESMVVEILKTLSINVGTSTIIKIIKDDFEENDEVLRLNASKIMAILTLTMPSNSNDSNLSTLLPLINTIANSQDSWKARQSGIRIIQYVLKFNNSSTSLLPNLNAIIECFYKNLQDSHIQNRILSANTLSILAKNCYPYGIESFNPVLELIWKGIRNYRGKLLSSFLRCLANIIPLMDSSYSSFYSKQLILIIKRELNTPDDDMKMTILLLLQNLIPISNITQDILLDDILPQFFEFFWIRRISLDKTLVNLVIYSTVKLATKIDPQIILENLLLPMRDDSESLRIMSIRAMNKVLRLDLNSSLNERLRTRMIDTLLIAFQDQTLNNDRSIFNCFKTVCKCLKKDIQPFLPPIISIILNNLKHKNPQNRQNSADLCTILIPSIKICEEFQTLNKLSVILFESLNEIYPDTLGSIIIALNEMVICNTMNTEPPVSTILPTLTSILRNSHVKVQLNTIRIISNIAQLSPDTIPHKEWLRICFQLLDLLKSVNKKIRVLANDTFGYIAKAIGPQDILPALLDNLNLQERQLRVCTAVALGIIAKVCGPYTVLPALMNEYRTPETNVQNGILKSLSFMFEYIGPDLTSDYIYFIIPLLEDALIDRDLVHRQTASEVIKHLSLNCIGKSTESAFIHFLNLLLPNIYETSPHAIMRIFDALESLCFTIGPGIFMNYIWAGIFHPAKSVRACFWRLYNRLYIQNMHSLIAYYPTENLIQPPSDNSDQVQEICFDELNIVL
ncbi:hypothetical protein TBLA_0C06730 [Henningerozyma blattae CBS 6284]|uniref:Phosphatase PP2A regulatory subunit A/Splicing factor 3B subunit 1-like HEAT repeat domain-containing protein n=1 Tax=Henningerozyma blattae (strain ATCC 34711 / CBS 6284 / DSM 70876 / NBRC 10599 / NRRL Y-10934 / UCD 77-7) TaxID=1071380 RepID=I2H263_HENB6|nr:hypothetical protein TBLA_0C06730 [Tetrapisispora blattae CBS 6284]CCH60465.1 hypothetical protein TBLA_0C06730 [Tetrapisispora blattae CBS 6284]